MDKKEKLDIYNSALTLFGFSNQRLMLVEECGELLDVIAKIKRNRATIQQVITELADVSIMVEQMAFFYGWDDFKAEKERKLMRLQERIIEKGGKP
ncbi:MAG: hypothetical protein IJ640_09500 [Prevotella sp.]|nr:hypothetical protein [Prevotella sp.]